MRVLLIEDDREAAQYLTKGLAESGHVVDHAPDGPRGLVLATSEPYDVLIVDRMLPGLDGLETLARFMQTGATTPVILFTASAPDVAERARAAGAWACVSKTGGWAELRAAIAGALAHGS